MCYRAADRRILPLIHEHLVVGSGYLEYRRPMIVGWKVTRKWLLSEMYEQMTLLRDIAAAASEERAAAA